MIRCGRLWTGQHNSSHVQDGWLDMKPGRTRCGSGHQWRLEGAKPA